MKNKIYILAFLFIMISVCGLLTIVYSAYNNSWGIFIISSVLTFGLIYLIHIIMKKIKEKSKQNYLFKNITTINNLDD